MLSFEIFYRIWRNAQIPKQLFFNHAVNRNMPRIDCKYKNQEALWKKWKFVRRKFWTVIYQSKHRRHVGTSRGYTVVMTSSRILELEIIGLKMDDRSQKRDEQGKGQIIALRFENKLNSRIWTAYWNTSFRSKTNYHRLPRFYHTFTPPVPRNTQRSYGEIPQELINLKLDPYVWLFSLPTNITSVKKEPHNREWSFKSQNLKILQPEIFTAVKFTKSTRKPNNGQKFHFKRMNENPIFKADCIWLVRLHKSIYDLNYR